jgi:hypothetical protein
MRGIDEIKQEDTLGLSTRIIIIITMMTIRQVRQCIRYVMLQSPLHLPAHPRHIRLTVHHREEHHRIVI